MFNEIMEIIIKILIVIAFVLSVYTCVHIIKNTTQPSGSILYNIDYQHQKEIRQKQLELEKRQRLYYKIQQLENTDVIQYPSQKRTIYNDETMYYNNDPLYSYRNDIQNIRDMESKLRRDKRLSDARMTR